MTNGHTDRKHTDGQSGTWKQFRSKALLELNYEHIAAEFFSGVKEKIQRFYIGVPWNHLHLSSKDMKDIWTVWYMETTSLQCLTSY